MLDGKSILLVISKFPPEYSGPGVRIPRLYDWFREKRSDFNLKVLCNGVERTKNETYYHDGLEVQRITAGKFYGWLSFLPKRLSHFLIYQIEFVQCLFVLFFFDRYKNIDFLHVAGHSGGTAAALLWAERRKIPVLMELVTEYARHQQKFFFFGKASVPENGMVVALTDKAKNECIKKGLDKTRIWSRPNPIDNQKFKPEFEKKYDLRKSLTPFGKEHIVISNVAKMMPQKNQFLVLKTLVHLPENYVAVLAGPFVKEGTLYERDKKYMATMQAFIKANNLQSRVHLVADFVEADQYMKLADIYAMPAWNEGFGTPMMEAMGCGLPVVANQKEAAFQQWIKKGENGYLCDIQKSEEWAQAIEKASKIDENQCLTISADIHKKAGQEAIYNHYEAVIEGLFKNTQTK